MQFKTSGELASYYSALSVPRSVMCQFDNLVQMWIGDNGLDWTIDRLKSIYTDYVRFHAGLPPVGKWYKKNKEGLPSGILSHIFKYSLKNRKTRFSCGTLLRCYTRFTRKEPSEKQMTKFLTGVNSEYTQVPEHITTGVLDAANEVLGKIFVEPNQPSYISFNPSPGKRVPIYDGSTAPEETHWFSQWATLDKTATGKRLKAEYHSIFSRVFSGFIRMTTGDQEFGKKYPDSVGKIGLIQEPGYKLRAVANPNRVYQMALKPLGDAVYKVLPTLGWDCTHNQSKGIPVIQEHLQKGKRCHCIDLTGATDYFPLDLQLDVLINTFIGIDDYIHLFEDLSKSPWTLGNTTITWKRGQPLGLYPSFGSFALSHGLLLYYLNGNKWDKMFYVLGDDVVILDDSLALNYLRALSDMGCPISESKSITSSRMAEFGGKLIYPDKVDPQLKWRQLSDDNFVDIVRLLGPKSLRLLRPKQRRVVKAIWDIPDFVGGLGFNPDGIPLEKRYEKYLELKSEDSSTYLMSYDRKFNQFFNSSVKSTSKKAEMSQRWNGSTYLPDLDQRSAALVSKHIPSMNRWYGIMGTNLYSVSPKGVLAIDGATRDRKTLLDLLSSKLGI